MEGGADDTWGREGYYEGRSMSSGTFVKKRIYKYKTPSALYGA